MAKRSSGTTKVTKSARRRPTPPPATAKVMGRASQRDTKLPVADVLIEAIAASPVGERALGRATTNELGRYEIDCTLTEPTEDVGVNLIVRALHPDGTVLATSEVLRNAPANALIDLVLDAISSGPAEYRRVLSYLEAPAGVELPHQRERVELLREAARRSEETGIPAELLYALGREGLPL